MKGQIRFTENRNLILFFVTNLAAVLVLPNSLLGQVGGNGQFNSNGNSGLNGQSSEGTGFQGQAITNTNDGTGDNGNPASVLNRNGNNANQKQQNFAYRVKVDDQDIEAFLFGGKELEALIPEELRGRVDRIIIEYIGTKYKNAADIRPGVGEFGQANQGFGGQANGTQANGTQFNNTQFNNTQANDLTGRVPNNTNPTAPYDRFANAQGNGQFTGQGTNPALGRRDSNALNNNASPNGQPNTNALGNSPDPNASFNNNDWQATRSNGNTNSNYSTTRKFAAQDGQSTNYGNGNGIQIGNMGNNAQNQPQNQQFNNQYNPSTLNPGTMNPGTLNPSFGGQNTNVNSPGAFRDNGQVAFNQSRPWQTVQSDIPPNPNLTQQQNTNLANNSAKYPTYEQMAQMLGYDPRVAMYNNSNGINNLQNQDGRATQPNNAYTNTNNPGNLPGNFGQRNNTPTSVQSPGDQNNASENKSAQNDQKSKAESSPSDKAADPTLDKSNNGALALFALLCISLGANACLGWFARGFYVRYRELAEELRSTLTVAA